MFTNIDSGREKGRRVVCRTVRHEAAIVSTMHVVCMPNRLLPTDGRVPFVGADTYVLKRQSARLLVHGASVCSSGHRVLRHLQTYSNSMVFFLRRVLST